jgi:GDP-mannose 6-dehydrogenase
MNVVVYGAGYVGTVSAACLVRLGHGVTVVDTIPAKVELIRHGQSPVVEEGLDALVAQGVAQGSLRATCDGSEALADADLALVCVGTPGLSNGAIDGQALRRVLQSLATAALHRRRPLATVVRSTVLAPVLREILAQIEPSRGAIRLQIVLNPEFMREATAIADFFHPPFIVVGSDSPEAMELALDLYRGIEAPRFKVSLETASVLKYACNAFHTIKVAFANEIDTVAALVGANGSEVMQLLTKDKVLNISPAYLRPGFAFGGSCLPKDVRALQALGGEHGEPLHLLSGVLASNQRRIEQALEVIAAGPARRLAMVGLTFKLGSDDLRESPYVELAERLVDQGFDLRIYDPDLQPERLLGANRIQAFDRLPRLAGMLVNSPEEALAEAEGVVLCKKLLGDQVLRRLLPPQAALFDLEYMTPVEGRKCSPAAPVLAIA